MPAALCSNAGTVWLAAAVTTGTPAAAPVKSGTAWLAVAATSAAPAADCVKSGIVWSAVPEATATCSTAIVHDTHVMLAESVNPPGSCADCEASWAVATRAADAPVASAVVPSR